MHHKGEGHAHEGESHAPLLPSPLLEIHDRGGDGSKPYSILGPGEGVCERERATEREG